MTKGGIKTSREIPGIRTVRGAFLCARRTCSGAFAAVGTPNSAASSSKLRVELFLVLAAIDRKRPLRHLDHKISC